MSNFSEEEKEAIDVMTRKMKLHEEKPTSIFTWLTLEEHYVRLLLNLIENQQKEIEELKDIDQKICNEVLLEEKYVKEKFISKDKIREKIKELELTRNSCVTNTGIEVITHKIIVLEQLLEE